MLRIAVLLFSLFLLLGGAVVAYEGWKNPEPTRTTVADYVKSDKSKKWVVLTDAEIDLSEAVSVTGQIDGKIFKLYIPIRNIRTQISELFTQDAVNLLLETDDEEILNVYRQLRAMPEAKRLQFLLENRPKLVRRSVELSGLVSQNSLKSGRDEEIRKHIKNLASDFYVLKHNSSVSLKSGLIMMGIGLLLLTFSLRGKKKAYENPSKPETRTADDSQSQPVKSPIPDGNESQVSHYQPPPLMQKHCLTCNAVIHRQAELCPHCGVLQSVPPPDRDNSQDSPCRPPTVSLTNADRNTTEIELADRGTRLRAVINDVLIISIPAFFQIIVQDGFGLNFHESHSPAALLVNGVTTLSFIGLIMTNLVLLYRHGQTLGKRERSIKIVNAEGSRAGLGTLLMRGLVIIPFLIYANLTKDFTPLILIVLLDSLLIFQNSRRCLHDMIAKTTVVKVFPGKNDSPYGSLIVAIGTSIFLMMVPVLAATMIFAYSAYSDSLRRAKVFEAIEFLNAQKESAEKVYLKISPLSYDGFLPPGRFPLTTKISDKYTASLVSSRSAFYHRSEFYLEATMNKEEDVLGGKTARLIYQPDTKTWICSAAYPNGIPQEYLPSECK